MSKKGEVHFIAQIAKSVSCWFVLPYIWNNDSLNDLNDFIEQASRSLCSELKDNDYEGLLCVMGCLIKVRERQEETIQGMFQSICEQIDLLKTYGVDFPEEAYDPVVLNVHSSIYFKLIIYNWL